MTMTTTLVFRQVLFATDFSEPARDAGRTAVELARHFGARLHVLHVVPPVTDPTPAPAALRAAAAELGDGVPVVTSLASGRPAWQIVDYARRNACDLIVLGTHGRTGVSRAILGSVAEGVVRRARCRVLTVPTSVVETPGAPVEVDTAVETTSCAVCASPTHDELICEACRARIRGEPLERKRGEERAGHR
jgi:nucleotide-binding universal stress UspA family protein